MLLEQKDVVSLHHAANDAFAAELVASIPKTSLTKDAISLLEKIQAGEASVDEINDYREILNTDANSPILSKDAFRGDGTIAAEMSLESISDTLETVIESVARFIRKMWEFLKGLLDRFRVMLNKLLLSLQKKSKDLQTKHFSNVIPDVNEYYVTIKENAAKMSFYNHGTRAFTTDIMTTTRSVKTMFEQCFMPLLRSEVSAAQQVSELNTLVLDAIAKGNRDSARLTSEKISQIFNEQARKNDDLLKGFSGQYINGLEITSGGQNLRFKVNTVTPPSIPFRIKALGASELEQLLDLAMSITKELKEIADAEYKSLQKIYDTTSKNVEEFIASYSKAKKGGDALKRKDYELLETTVSKGVSHFQKITNSIASVMNTMGRFAWTVEDSFYKENIRILELIKNTETGKVSLEECSGVVTDQHVDAICNEVNGEMENVAQEIDVTNEHYYGIIERLRAHIGSIVPNTAIAIMDNACFSFQNSIVPEAVVKGITVYTDYVRSLQQVLATDSIREWVKQDTNCEFIGGGVSNGILFKNVAVDINQEYTLNDINTILNLMCESLSVVKGTLITYKPKLLELHQLVNKTYQDLEQCPNGGSLVERSAIKRRLIQERNLLLSDVNVLAVNAYLYDAIDEFTEAVFRELYN